MDLNNTYLKKISDAQNRLSVKINDEDVRIIFKHNVIFLRSIIGFLNNGYPYDQKTFAEKIGITPGGLRKWETGTSIPNRLALEKITLILNATLPINIKPESLLYKNITDILIDIITYKCYDNIRTGIFIMEGSEIKYINKYVKKIFGNIENRHITIINDILGTIPDTSKSVQATINDYDRYRLKNYISSVINNEIVVPLDMDVITDKTRRIRLAITGIIRSGKLNLIGRLVNITNQYIYKKAHNITNQILKSNEDIFTTINEVFKKNNIDISMMRDNKLLPGQVKCGNYINIVNNKIFLNYPQKSYNKRIIAITLRSVRREIICKTNANKDMINDALEIIKGIINNIPMPTILISKTSVIYFNEEARYVFNKQPSISMVINLLFNNNKEYRAFMDRYDNLNKDVELISETGKSKKYHISVRKIKDRAIVFII